MKHKRLILVAIVVFVFSMGLILYTKRQSPPPSQQMKELRQLEAHLDLPKPKYRDEEDLGLNEDWKGAPHYDRRITLSYEDASVLDVVRTKLLHDGWKEQAAETAGTDTHFSFKKGSGDAVQCVGGYTGPKNSDGIALYIALEASGEYSCNPAPGT